MGILIKISVLMTALSASVFSAPAEVFFEKVISGGENISCVVPIIDVNNELSGFIYTDSSQNKIFIDKIGIDSIIAIDIPTPLRSIVRYSELKDTLYIYTLGSKDRYITEITLTTFYDQIISKKTTQVFINPTLSVSMFSTRHTNHLDLRFYPDDKNPLQVILEHSYRFENHIFTIGDQSFDSPTSLVYNLDLSEILVKSPQTSIYPASLYSFGSKNYVYVENYFDSFDYSNPLDPENYGTTAFQKLKIYDNFDNLNSQLTTSYDSIHSVHVNNFAPSSPTDELIIHANSEDLLGNYNKENHIACYSFAGGSPTELWYNNEVTGLDFSYVFKSKDLLIGMNGSDKIVMLNYLNGYISDSSDLESNLIHQNFFETGSNQPLLNLVGMSGDTVKSYRFDISTNIAVPSIDDELPQTFLLMQNHPNPFNGETRLEFSNTESQYLKLSIFNILGQEIKILTASRFAAGTYAYYWDGNNDAGLSQSTGIYFARLESETTSQMIKLIYLK